MEDVKVLKEKQFVFENEIEYRKKELEVYVISPSTQTNEESILQTMS